MFTNSLRVDVEQIPNNLASSKFQLKLYKVALLLSIIVFFLSYNDSHLCQVGYVSDYPRIIYLKLTIFIVSVVLNKVVPVDDLTPLDVFGDTSLLRNLATI